MTRTLKSLLVAAGIAAAALGLAQAAGVYTNGFPVAALPLTGNELIPADTQLPNGVSPQTEAISVNSLKSFIFGNAAAANATATTGAATADGGRGIITSEALTTAAGAVYTLTLTNSSIAATSLVFVSVGNGTNSAGSPALTTVVPAAGSAVIKIQNIHASNALNGTLKVSYFVVN